MNRFGRIAMDLWLKFFIITILLLAADDLCECGQRISEGCLNSSCFTEVTVSEKGLNYARELLVDEALQSLIPLRIPDMKKSVKVPYILDFKAKLYDAAVANISVPSSSVHLGKIGINIIASQVQLNLTMKWRYSYTTGFIPFTVSDKGRAFVQVDGMEVGITLKLDEKNGSLYLITVECGTSLKDITITLDGGASWFYQGFVDAFEGEIRAAVEKAVTSKIKEGILKLDSLLQNLPKEIGIDSTIALNFTVMEAPDVGPKSISIGVEGLFVAMTPPVVRFHQLSDLQSGIACSGPSKMLEISLSEAVFNSAAEVYSNEGLLNWLVDKLPEQSLLNTASWRFIIPKLYKKYPNDEMKLNISVSSPPTITITSDGVEAIVVADMIIDVMDGNDSIPVACISM
ncbi:hypothetical protein KI387_031068, partial [Taxus chinensis]